MPVFPSLGRTSTSAGAAQSSGRSNATTPVAPVPMAQTSPSTMPQPRFRPGNVQPVPVPGQGPNQLPQWRSPENANDRLIFRDRAPQLSRGYERSGRISSMPDPPSDGPVRPSMRLMNQTWNWQAGTGSAYTDDPTRQYTTASAGGRRFFFSSDATGGWQTVYGGAPGFYRQGPGGAPVGDPSQGPAHVFSGPPHGLHTEYPPERQQSLAGFRARPQMVAPRVDRLSNSRIAGQNYSQWTRHQGGTSR